VTQKHCRLITLSEEFLLDDTHNILGSFFVTGFIGLRLLMEDMTDVFLDDFDFMSEVLDSVEEVGTIDQILVFLGEG
jgi:hypothetical protein